ncbi:MAG: peptidylprolyl isomerase [Sphingomonadales bacterium 32-68-7]|nr:MAG: peptidylprolyl isomerase [Sphingomonadales bacterium 12-68-11]OYX08710.1 MAG: peptidylprolyl isomerase [Sphingomonadales bacterium 32-68-7]
MTRLPPLTLALALAATALPAAAQDAPAPVTPASVVAGAPASDWRAIDPADLLVMTLAPDAAGQPRVVTIQLIPPPFSQGWVGNIRTLAKAHWWDGTSVYRVVDNWVTQWGDGEDDAAKAKRLPAGLREVPESEYTADAPSTVTASGIALYYQANAGAQSPSLFNGRIVFRGQKSWDYAAYAAGFPYSGSMDPHRSLAWPIHCYASVGVARDLSPNTGSGAELYTVIGHAPRQLDRNIAVVGRVIEGIEHLSALPRGKGEAGVYSDPTLRVPIVSVRLGDELPAADQPKFEYLDTDSASFARYLEVSANRNDPFYRVPAGGIDICNAKVPIRRVKP